MDAIARWRLQPGQLLIIDEAGLAGTFALDELVGAQATPGRRSFSRRLGSARPVDAGGAFGLLVRPRRPRGRAGRGPPVQLGVGTAASIELRHGNESALDTYESHDRITGGTREELLEAVYTAWKHDIDAGTSSLMIAPDTATVTELNRRARADRVAGGDVAEDGLKSPTGRRSASATRSSPVATTAASPPERLGQERRPLGGDCHRRRREHDRAAGAADTASSFCRRTTSLNMSSLLTPRPRIVPKADRRDRPRARLAEHDPRSPLRRRHTRPRANCLYVDTAYDPDPQTSHDTPATLERPERCWPGCSPTREPRSPPTRPSAGHSASPELGEPARRVPDLAQAAQAERWNTLLEHSGLTDQQLQQVRQAVPTGRSSPRSGTPTPGASTSSPPCRGSSGPHLADTDDPASVLHERVERWMHASGGRRQPRSNLIAGLMPRALGVTDPDFARALDERDRALEGRARDARRKGGDRTGPGGSVSSAPPGRSQAASAVGAGHLDGRRLPRTLEHHRRPPTPRSRKRHQDARCTWSPTACRARRRRRRSGPQTRVASLEARS